MVAVAQWEDVALPEPPARPARRLRWVQACAAHGAALALFTLLTVCRAWPIVLHPASTVAPDLIDPVHHIWSAAASIHYATTLPQGLWSFFDANIFYPTPHAAAYADVFVGLLPLSLPLHLLIHNPVVLINVLAAAAFILSAYGAFLLGRTVTGSYWAAVVAGLVFGFCPLRDQQIGHVTIISTEWQVAAALCLVCAWRRGGWGWWGLAGVFLGLSAVTNLYYAAYLTAPLLLAAALLGRTWTPGKIKGALLASGIAAMLVVPSIVPYLVRQTTIEPGYGTGGNLNILTLFQVFANRPVDSLLLPATAMQPLHANQSFFPGFAAVALALVAWRLRRGRLWAAFAAGCLMLALGPELQIGGRVLPLPLPYAWLSALVPHFSLFRDPPRALMGFSLGLAVLAAYGTHEVLRRVRLRRRRIMLAVALVGMVAVESWATVPTAHVAAIPKGEYWLARQPRIHVVAELPLANTTATDWMRQTEIMYDSTVHWKNLVNGSASVDPTGMATRRAVLDTFPSTASLRLLRRLHVDAVVLRLPWLPAQQVVRAQAVCHTAYRDDVEQICIGPWS